MQFDIGDLLNQVEVVPVSLSDPFKSLIVESSTMQILRFIPIIAFIALLMAAVLRQSRKFPVQAIGDLKNTNNQE